MTNFEKTKEMLTLEKFIENFNICSQIRELRGTENCGVQCPSCIEWLKQEYKETVLDKAEKEYLAALIRPFRDEVRNIEKLKYAKDLEQICIGTYEYERDIFLPSFDEGVMYKGMELNKEYTLEELGL